MKQYVTYTIELNTMYKTFKDIPLNTVFTFNGTQWLKRSTRTAELHGSPTRWFYFGKNEVIKPHIHLLDDDYYGVPSS